MLVATININKQYTEIYYKNIICEKQRYKFNQYTHLSIMCK